MDADTLRQILEAQNRAFSGALEQSAQATQQLASQIDQQSSVMSGALEQMRATAEAQARSAFDAAAQAQATAENALRAAREAADVRPMCGRGAVSWHQRRI